MSKQAAKQVITPSVINEKMRELLASEQANAGQYQEDNAALYDDFIEPPSGDELVIMNALDELSTVEGAQVRVYREQKGQPLEYLFSPPFSDDLLTAIFETVQMEYGKGTYRIHARTPQGALKMNRQINVGEPPRSKLKVLEAATVPVKDNSMMEFMQLQMQAQQAAALQSKTDMMQMFTMMQNSSAEMMKAIAGRPESHGEQLGIKDILSIVQMVNGDGKKSDATEVLLQGIKLGREFADGGNGGEGFGDLAKIALGGIGDIVKNMPKQPVQVPMQYPQGQMQAPQMPRIDNPAPVELDDDTLNFEALGRILVIGATRNGDLETYAMLVCDTIGDDQAGTLCDNPHNMALVIDKFPLLASHTEWLENVRVTVMELLIGDNMPDTLEPVDVIDNSQVLDVSVIPETADIANITPRATGDKKPTGKRSQ